VRAEDVRDEEDDAPGRAAVGREGDVGVEAGEAASDGFRVGGVGGVGRGDRRSGLRRGKKRLERLCRVVARSERFDDLNFDSSHVSFFPMGSPLQTCPTAQGPDPPQAMVDTEKKRREKRTRRILLSIKRFMRRKWVFPPQAQKRVLHRGTESINDGRKKGKKSRD